MKVKKNFNFGGNLTKKMEFSILRLNFKMFFLVLFLFAIINYTQPNLTPASLTYNGNSYDLPTGSKIGYDTGSSISGDTTGDQFTRIYEGAMVTDDGFSFGVAWIDYDNDDFLDLFVTNWMNPGQRNCLYHNNGNGTFSKVTSGIIVNEGGSLSSSWGDIDNDGDLDVICANPGYGGAGAPNYFYLNNGDGSFTKVTDDILATDVALSITPAWADYNNDGYLDLFVGNHCPPPNCYGDVPRLYLNDGGVFSKMDNVEIGLTQDEGRGLWADYDGDGDLDLYIYRPQLNTNAMFENNGDGSFTEITSGVINEDSATSCSWGDYDNDGDLDLFAAGCGMVNILYQNIGNGDFIRVVGQVFDSDSGYWNHSSWADYDNDGDLDIYVSSNYDYNPRRNTLYENNGDGTFSKITQGVVVSDSESTSGIAWGDYDRDGDLDLFATNTNYENNILYRNNGNSNNWLNIKCSGTASNRSAIGAKVRVKAAIGGAPGWQLHEISAQSGFLCQNSLNAHFGLRDAVIVDSLKVEWPSGMVDVFINIDVNQFITITETICGDSDGDASIEVTDAVYLINYLFKGGTYPHCTPEPYTRCADVNGDEQVNICDVVYLIRYLFKGGPEPEC